MRWPSLVYGVIFEILSMFSAASSNLAPSEIIKIKINGIYKFMYILSY